MTEDEYGVNSMTDDEYDGVQLQVLANHLVTFYIVRPLF
jgi:hypothetical protein